MQKSVYNIIYSGKRVNAYFCKRKEGREGMREGSRKERINLKLMKMEQEYI